MIWTTPVPIDINPNPIDYHSKIFSIGSCFAVNIAEKLSLSKFESSVNPFGILFHPAAINDVFSRIVNNHFFNSSDVFDHNGIWQSYSVHSSLSRVDQSELLCNLNALLAKTKQEIQEATHVLITYGTSWVYRNTASDELVANCHKVSSKMFTKEILSVAFIENLIESSIRLLLQINPDIQITFTISPVRHFKDGIIENQRSKSNLFSALHSVLTQFDTSQVRYFPSYEIVMDELRDYRFYAKDLLHPNEIAIDYIWNRFSETNFSESAQGLMKKVLELHKAISHRPIGEHTLQHQAHIKATQLKIDEFVRQNPQIRIN